MSNIINADNGVVSGIAGVKLSSDSTGVLDIQTNGTTAITISTAQVVSLTNSPTFTGGTANGVLYLNASKVATSGSALVFDGTNLGVGTTPTVYAGYNTLAQNAATGSTFEQRVGGVLTGSLTADSQVTLKSLTAIPVVFGTNNTERARIDSSGNLGLGVAPSAWDTTVFRTLQVGSGAGSASLSGRTDGNQSMLLGSNLYYNSAVLKYVGTGSATYYNQENGAHWWSTAASGTAGNTISFTQAMTLDASGNLGIGTTSPNSRLDVAGANAIVSVTPTTQNQSTSIDLRVLNASTYGSARIQAVNNTTYDSNLLFYTNTTTSTTLVERARIPAAGGFQCVNSISVGNATPTTSGAGITFPASQSASSDANTLDDYEEGSWTPVLTSTGTAPTGVSYSFRGGWYRKIGSMVVAGFGFSLSSKGTGATGNIRITGLPFTGAYYGSYQEPAVAMNSGIWNTADIAGKSYLYNPDSTSNLEGRYQNNADTVIAYTDVTNSTYMNCVITYYV